MAEDKRPDEHATAPASKKVKRENKPNTHGGSSLPDGEAIAELGDTIGGPA